MLNRLLNLFKEQTSREYFLWMPVCLGTGAGMYFIAPHFPMYMTYAPLLCVLIGLIYNKFFMRSYFFYGLLYLILGYSIMTFKVGILDTPLLQKNLPSLTLRGTIVDILDKEQGQQWVIGAIENPPTPLKKVKVSFQTTPLPSAHIGDHVEGNVSLFPFHPPIFPGGLDQRRKAYLEGISAQGRLLFLHKVTKTDEYSSLARIRRNITERFYTHIPGESGAIAAALVTGERSKISFATRQAFADSGIAHILAISGLHLSLIAGFVFFMVRGGLALSMYITEKYPIKKWAAFFGIVFTCAYLLISGMGYPSIRAFIMTSIAMIAIMVNRRPISMRVLAIAAFIILLISPEAIISASFQLSFAAVTALIAFYDMGWRPLYLWSKDGGWHRKFIVYVTGIIFSTVIATLATTPFTMALFNRLTAQALLGNLLAIPLTGLFVMPSALLATLSMIFGGIQWCFDLFAWSIKTLSSIAFWVQSFPGAAILVPSLPDSFIILFAFGSLWICLWKGKLRLFGILPMSIACCIALTTRQPDILVSPKGIGFFHKGKLEVSKHLGWFEKAMWQRHLGVNEVKVWESDDLTDTNGILLIADPREHSKIWLKNKCATKDMKIIITNGYLDRLCQNTQLFSLESQKNPNKFPLLISRLNLKGGTIVLWLHPLKIENTSDVDKDKPWGHKL